MIMIDKIAVNDEGLLYFETTVKSQKNNKEYKAILNFNKILIDGVEYDNTYPVCEHEVVSNTLDINEKSNITLLADCSNIYFTMTIKEGD